MFYDARPARRVRQVLLDLVVVVGCVLAVVLGTVVSGAISRIAAVGTRIDRDGSAFQEQLGRAASALGKVPFAGDAVRRPLQEASARAGAVAAAGAEQHDATLRLAHLVGSGVAVVLVVALLLVWLSVRGRAVWNATATARLARRPAGTELLAVRALLTRAAAADLGPDVVDRWRRGDPATVRALADLERRSSGLPTGTSVD